MQIRVNSTPNEIRKTEQIREVTSIQLKKWNFSMQNFRRMNDIF